MSYVPNTHTQRHIGDYIITVTGGVTTIQHKKMHPETWLKLTRYHTVTNRYLNIVRPAVNIHIDGRVSVKLNLGDKLVKHAADAIVRSVVDVLPSNGYTYDEAAFFDKIYMVILIAIDEHDLSLGFSSRMSDLSQPKYSYDNKNLAYSGLTGDYSDNAEMTASVRYIDSAFRIKHLYDTAGVSVTEIVSKTYTRHGYSLGFLITKDSCIRLNLTISPEVVAAIPKTILTAVSHKFLDAMGVTLEFIINKFTPDVLFTDANKIDASINQILPELIEILVTILTDINVAIDSIKPISVKRFNINTMIMIKHNNSEIWYSRVTAETAFKSSLPLDACHMINNTIQALLAETLSKYKLENGMSDERVKDALTNLLLPTLGMYDTLKQDALEVVQIYRRSINERPRIKFAKVNIQPQVKIDTTVQILRNLVDAYELPYPELLGKLFQIEEIYMDTSELVNGDHTKDKLINKILDWLLESTHLKTLDGETLYEKYLSKETESRIVIKVLYDLLSNMELKSDISLRLMYPDSIQSSDGDTAPKKEKPVFKSNSLYENLIKNKIENYKLPHADYIMLVLRTQRSYTKFAYANMRVIEMARLDFINWLIERTLALPAPVYIKYVSSKVSAETLVNDLKVNI